MRTAQFTPTEFPDRPRPWCVSIPATYSASGRRERKFFATKREAVKFAKDEKFRVDREGRDATSSLSALQREAAAKAFALIPDHPPQTIIEIVEKWTRQQKVASASAPLREVFDRYQARGKKGRSRSGATQWLPFRKSYLSQLKYARAKVEPLLDVLVANITAAQIERQMEGCSAAYCVANLRPLRAVMEFAVEEGLASTNPITAKMIEAKASLVKGNEDIETPILTLEETRRLLATAAKTAPQFIPYLALALFGGIRPDLGDGELVKLEWSMIRMKERRIIIPAKVSKTRRQRIVEMENNLVDWLNYHIAKHGEAHGKVVPATGIVNRMRKLRKEAGIKWEQDMARHSFCSYFMPHFENVTRCINNTGHKGTTMLFDHYMTAVPKDAAAEYWKITPQALGLR
jgi:integrase